MKKLLSMLPVLTLILLGCKEEVNPEPYTYSHLISGDTYKAWRVVYFSAQEDGKSDLNFSLFECDKDDLYYFYADVNRTFEIMGGRTQCNEDDPDLIAEGSWAVINARATMEFIIPFLSSSTIPWTIENLEEDEFEVSFHLNNEKSINVFFELEEQGDKE